MKKSLGIVLAIILVGLAVVLVSTSVFAATTAGSTLLANPLMRLWNAIHGMQDQITGLAASGGIQGPQGEPGPQGPSGECSCVISSADFQSLISRVESLEQNSGGAGMLPDCIFDSDCFDNNPCTDDACDPEVGCVYSDSGLCSDNTNDGTGGSSEGEVIVSEIMYNPDAVTDAYGEWFELYNPGESAVNLNGWSISDYGTDNFVFSDNIIIMPGDYAVLCKNIDSAVNGGIVCDAGYTSFTLGNTADALIITRPDASVSDAVSYDVSVEPWKNMNQAGYSLQLAPGYHNSADNDDGANWCNAVEPIVVGDFGTPGGINSECSAG